LGKDGDQEIKVYDQEQPQKDLEWWDTEKFPRFSLDFDAAKARY